MASALTQGDHRGEEPTQVPEGNLGLAVTGVDAQGHVFRERTALLSLDGRACKYQSKYEVQADSWVLLDIDYSKAGQKPCRVQGQVKSVLPSRTSDQLFQVSVELEVAQSVRVGAEVVEDYLVAQEPQDEEPPAAAIQPEPPAESVSPRRPAAPQTIGVHEALPRPRADESAAGSLQGPEQLANTRAQVLTIIRETAKSAVTSEISRHLEALKNWTSREVERAFLEGSSARLDQFLRAAVEKRISEKLEATIEAVNGEFASQLVTRLAGSEHLHACLRSAAENVAARLSELSQTTARKIEKDLTAHVTAIRQSFEGSVEETQRKLEDLRAGLESTLAGAQAAEREAASSALSLQEALERFKEEGRITAGELEKRHAAFLDAGLEEFNKQLDKTSVERAARFASEAEHQLMPYLQSAEETLEKLATLLQLAQGIVRVQEERLAELTRSAAANLEREINALFLRLSGNA